MSRAPARSPARSPVKSPVPKKTLSPRKGQERGPSPQVREDPGDQRQQQQQQKRQEQQQQGSADFVRCELCRNKIEDPRTLQCLHSFCRSCLLTYISETKAQRGVTCPLCLQITEVQNSGKSATAIVDELSANPFLVDYLEALSLQDGTKKCDTCQRQGKSKLADKWCGICHDALCEECVGFHNALRTTTQHNLMDISKIRRQSLQDVISTPLCPEHEAEPLLKYCGKHRKAVCEKCIASKHKDCRDITTAKDAVKRQQREMTDSSTSLLEEEKLAKSIQDNRSKESKTLDTQQEDVLQKIQDVRQKVNEQLSKCESKIIGELYDIHAKEKATVQGEMKEAQRMRKSVNKIKGLVENGHNYGTESHQLQTLPGSMTAVDHYKGKLGSLNGRITCTKIDFIVDPILQKVMNINRLGELKVSKTSDVQPAHGSLINLRQKQKKSDSDPEDEMDVKASRTNLNPDSFKSANFLNSFDGRTSSDYEQCWFTGVAYMPNGQLILVDRNNNKIKVFSKEHKLVSEHSLEHQPFGIAVMGPNEIAVTIPRENKIEIFSVEFTVKHTGTINTSDRCYGISYYGNEFVLTCACASPPAITLMLRSGEEKNTICPEENHYPMFFRPWYVKYDAGGHYYVSDANKSTVTCITASVMKRFTYKSNTMNSPRGLYVTKSGAVLVCGFGSDNVQLVGSDGRLTKDVLSRSDGIIGPQDVALNPEENQMVVTFDPSSGSSEVVKVFKYST